MAIVKGALQITGGIKGVSFYTLPGNDKVFMRTKGGPKSGRMKTGKEFEKLRKHQVEWAACVKFSQGVSWAMGYNSRLADFNVAPGWNGMGKKLMNLDTEHPVGERVIRLTRYKQVLENFSLNRNYQFNAVVRVFPTFELSRETYKASVKFPRINGTMDLLNIQRLPYYRLIISLGVASDVLFYPEETICKYQPTLRSYNGFSNSELSDWHSTTSITDELTLEVKLNDSVILRMTDEMSIIMGIGIEFGNTGFAGEIAPVKRAGCSKILCIK